MTSHIFLQLENQGDHGLTAAPHYFVKLPCQVEQGSVPQSQGINFPTKANQNEKGTERAGVVVQFVAFPFSMGFVGHKSDRAVQEKHTSK